ncbi:molybdopterin-guanine dinucleotide biosynthesis protein MobA [Nocardioides psychrotolerans]|uniref:Molybdenum cofactor cytidylyltransferase/nicotine blue oxidoreductase n=1 Tax=Nocardioides psychrotolerans TaxID=1005945 RepID=A0A1I3BU34_9ACTN|nr:nucleotidyltransferase family protein [Nocardioides psychrotolerans]GEP36451.1 molybdopterin-guanine dinucleotide biosynthesis protein MobA [Nocardioides psychrotolerans]SFH65797.1 molybdenum cofactor cytidylyltransferase/nicotine blue oxidoreductase [Nocardioides psychrotolerans]
MSVEGVLLAAGAGSRMGMPKALVHDEDGGPWVARGVQSLIDGGCDRVTVVLGACADEAVRLLDGLGVDVVIASDWADGMSASLRAGLRALPEDGEAAMVLLVDLPDVTADVVRRVVAAGTDRADLRRAAYDGRPGHPVLIGREHWAGVLAEASGDEGARSYLAAHEVDLVECGDLATGHDVDAR